MPDDALPSAVADALEHRPPPTEAEIKARLALEAERVEKAETRKREFLGLVRGSKLRIGVLEAEVKGDGLGLTALAGNLGLAVADLAMMHVVNGNVTFRSAEEAMKVAKLGLDIHRAMAGDSEADLASMTPEQRDQRRAGLIAGIQTLGSLLRSRAEEAEASGALTMDEIDAVPAAPEPAPKLVAPSPPEPRAVGTVRSQ